MKNLNHNETSKSVNKQYFYEIHFLRALACVAVLIVHVTATHYYIHEQTFNWLTLFLNQISRFGTPMFAVISGFLLFYQVHKRGFNFNKFLKSRTAKLIMPFFFWSIFYLLFKKYVLNVQITVNPSFVFDFIMGNSYAHLYFISLVIQFYILFPLLQMIRTKLAWWITTMLALAIHVYFSSFSISNPTTFIEHFINHRAFFPSWIFYFMFGGLLAVYWDSLVQRISKFRNVFIILNVTVVIGAVIEYNMMGSIPANRITNLINIPILALSIISIYGLLDRWKSTRQLLKLIGTLSMGIYLIHPVVLFVFAELLPIWMWQTRYFPIVFCAIFIVTILVVKLIQLLPYHQYLIPVPNPNKRSQSNEHNLTGRISA